MEYSSYIEHLNEVAKAKGIPFQGDFELTAKCNLACNFCYVSSENEMLQKDLSLEQWINIIQQAVSAGMIRATFTGGEVLTRTDFEELYCKTYDMGVRILILTNGLLLNDKMAKFLQKRPPEGISMTLYGASNDSYKKVTGNYHGFDMAIKSIEIMKANNLPLSLKTIALPDLINDYGNIRTIADNYNLEINLVKYLSPQRGHVSNANVEWRMAPSKIKEIAKIVENKNAYEETAHKLKSCSLDCNCGKGRFSICYDGRMFGCLSYTQLYTYPLLDGFDNALTRLRELLNNQNDTCQDCTYCEHKEHCSMCPGLNFAESGSICICSNYRKELAKNKIL